VGNTEVHPTKSTSVLIPGHARLETGQIATNLTKNAKPDS
jgi:hypothetical protein